MVRINMFGRIHDLEAIKYNSTRLTLQSNLPFMTKYLRFNILFDENSFKKEDGTQFSIGDFVEAECVFTKPSRYKLIELRSAVFDSCPVCWCYMPTGTMTIEAGKMGCESCSRISENNHTQRVDKQLRLISLTYKKIYKYGKCVTLKLFNTLSDVYYTGVIFESNPLYGQLHNLEEESTYTVIGWLIADTIIDILHCY